MLPWMNQTETNLALFVLPSWQTESDIFIALFGEEKRQHLINIPTRLENHKILQKGCPRKENSDVKFSLLLFKITAIMLSAEYSPDT